MVRIILIRPGASDFDEQGRIQGTLSIPLSSEGAKQVAHIVDELRESGIEAVYCSGGEPACQTADAVAAGLGLKSRKLDNMQNVNHGLWQGMCIDEVRRKHPRVYKQWQEQPESVCPPEGEMLADAMQRVQAAIKRLLKKHKEGVIGLVVPEPLAGLVVSHLRQTELGKTWPAPRDNGRWEIIDIEPQTLATVR